MAGSNRRKVVAQMVDSLKVVLAAVDLVVPAVAVVHLIPGRSVFYACSPHR